MEKYYTNKHQTLATQHRAKKTSFTACSLGKLQLAFTGPRAILTSLRKKFTSREIS